MAAEIITTEDLRQFKHELISDFKNILKELSGQPSKKWLKSADVMKVLGLSSGTLQTLRLNGTLPYTKIGGVIFYDSEDIQKLLTSNKVRS